MIKLKTNKTFTKKPMQKIRNSENETKLENIIFGKLGLHDEIKNK
jgi:hypothetical protein